MPAGTLKYSWDGHAESGELVPDEAYSLRILLSTDGSTFEYFPAAKPAEELKVATNYYDRRTGVVSYDLPKPARVHMQAGVVKADEKTGKLSGPVLKTLINREPRPSGPVIETWPGMDESGSFYIPDLRGFAVSVAATSLPENAMIAVGNATLTFLESAKHRAGVSMLPPSDGDHAHHRGLTALDDVAPRLLVKPTNAVRSADQRWTVDGNELLCEVVLDGPSAGHFARQPGTLAVFIGERQVLSHSSPSSGMKLRIPLGSLNAGEHIVAFDWASAYGPVAVYSLLVDRPASGSLEAKARRSGR